MKYSACLEWLFADEAESFSDRIHLAKAAGLDAIEFWLWSNKNINEIEKAIHETGLTVTGFVAEPMIPLTDPANKAAFIAGLADSLKVAKRLAAKTLIVQAGADLPFQSRGQQRDALILCLREAAGMLHGTGVRIGVEPLNTFIDHKGYFLPSTVEALDIIDEIARPEIAIVYDVYHSAVMGEKTEEVLIGRLDRVAHVHIADHPGRGAPGTGAIDLIDRLKWMFANGYTGLVGLEFKPIRPTSQSLVKAFEHLAK